MCGVEPIIRNYSLTPLEYDTKLTIKCHYDFPLSSILPVLTQIDPLPGTKVHTAVSEWNCQGVAQ